MEAQLRAKAICLLYIVFVRRKGDYETKERNFIYEETALFPMLPSQQFWKIIEQLFHQRGLYKQEGKDPWKKTEMTLQMKDSLQILRY